MASGCLGVILRLLIDAVAVRIAHEAVDRVVGGVGSKVSGLLMGFLAAILALIGIRIKR
jgi:hypothetical protein